MSNLKQTTIYGFSIFAMFFGSGNLVFPLMVGINNPESWIFAFLGFFLTGIILPFLGLFVVKLYQGNYYRFFGEAGELAQLFIPLFTLSLLGPFGVIPRCITVAHGGLEFLELDIPLSIFSIIFCIICYIACINNRMMFNVVGKLLSPILLLFLLLLFVQGYQQTNLITIHPLSIASIKDGFFTGYATMDLFAAFFFSGLMFQQISSITPRNKSVVAAAIAPTMLGATLLGLVYLGFVFLGAHYKYLTQNLPSELILPAITDHLFGASGAIIISAIMILSCLTTSVALIGIYTDYLCSFTNTKNNNNPNKWHHYLLIITIIISFYISLLDFAGIFELITPLLNISYPSLIFLTITCFFVRGKKQMKFYIFYSIIFFQIILL